jgi:hypothetical protein
MAKVAAEGIIQTLIRHNFKTVSQRLMLKKFFVGEKNYLLINKTLKTISIFYNYGLQCTRSTRRNLHEEIQ